MYAENILYFHGWEKNILQVPSNLRSKNIRRILLRYFIDLRPSGSIQYFPITLHGIHPPPPLKISRTVQWYPLDLPLPTKCGSGRYATPSPSRRLNAPPPFERGVKRALLPDLLASDSRRVTVRDLTAQSSTKIVIFNTFLSDGQLLGVRRALPKTITIIITYIMFFFFQTHF